MRKAAAVTLAGVALCGCASGEGPRAPGSASDRRVAREAKLDCPLANAVNIDYAEGASGPTNPIAAARLAVRDRLEAGDLVEQLEPTGERLVGVLRGDRVLAVVTLTRGKHGWLAELVEACREFQLGP